MTSPWETCAQHAPPTPPTQSVPSGGDPSTPQRGLQSTTTGRPSSPSTSHQGSGTPQCGTATTPMPGALHASDARGTHRPTGAPNEGRPTTTLSPSTTMHRDPAAQWMLQACHDMTQPLRRAPMSDPTPRGRRHHITAPNPTGEYQTPSASTGYRGGKNPPGGKGRGGTHSSANRMLFTICITWNLSRNSAEPETHKTMALIMGIESQ